MSEAADILKDLQESCGVSPELLAHKMKVSHRTIERWTNGETEPIYAQWVLLKRIAKYYIKVARKTNRARKNK